MAHEGDVLDTTAPAKSDRPNGPRSRKGVQTRARLVDAAKEIFEEDGFLEARISDIAQHAGLSHGSFYHYFESKEEIFREVAAEVDERLSAPLNSVILDPSSTAPPHERIHEALRRHLESYREEARIIGVIEQVSRYDEHIRAVRLARHRRYTEQITGSIRGMQRHGMADRRLNPMIAASSLGAMTDRFAEMWLVQGFLHCRFDEAVDQLTLVYMNALRLSDGETDRPRGRRPRTR